jgi:uncharacterized protein (DUF1919 family)
MTEIIYFEEAVPEILCALSNFQYELQVPKVMGPVLDRQLKHVDLCSDCVRNVVLNTCMYDSYSGTQHKQDKNNKRTHTSELYFKSEKHDNANEKVQQFLMQF